MPKKRYWRTAADLAKARRRRQIEAGEIPGLFEKGAKTLRPEIRALIEAAVSKRAGAVELKHVCPRNEPHERFETGFKRLSLSGRNANPF